jgi:hypothetical protein
MFDVATDRIRDRPGPVDPAACDSNDKDKEESMNSWYLWTAPVRNLTWVAAHFGHR